MTFIPGIRSAINNEAKKEVAAKPETLNTGGSARVSKSAAGLVRLIYLKTRVNFLP